MRSAPRCDALTVAVEVLASAGDLLLNDVVTIPVLAAVRHDHRGIAGLAANSRTVVDQMRDQ